jgi:transposase-like protein
LDATGRIDGEQTTVGEPERRGGERSEAPRSGGSPAVEREPAPDPEVRARPGRRRFTPKYKLEILRKADACTRPGQVGELLRKEGLYSSHLVNWRRQRDAGLAPKKRGRKAEVVNPKLRKLEQENRRLERKLKKAEAIIAFQKKVHELLGIPLKPFESEEDD